MSDEEAVESAKQLKEWCTDHFCDSCPFKDKVENSFGEIVGRCTVKVPEDWDV